jgi:hypothetical protein
VIYVYSSPRGSGALVLTPDAGDPVRVISLDTLTEDAARRHANQLLLAHNSPDDAARAAARQEIPSILEWMWDTITGPILTALSLTAVPGAEDWPRVWWCPVGILAYLPLHAAGYHGDLASGDSVPHVAPRTVIDRVVSSYTSTVQGLAYARTRAGSERPAMAIITAPNVPGVQSLPGAAAEAAAIAALVPGARTFHNPGRAEVLSALANHAIAHFACHGYADWANPADSRLILPDYETAPLTVADLTSATIAGTLAYLSACETSVTSQELADEAVHITGAFQLAGYQHVIGTLWPVVDSAAKVLAVEFYTSLTKDTSAPHRTDRAAAALHHAIRVMRARHPDVPTFWASHIHTGA